MTIKESIQNQAELTASTLQKEADNLSNLYWKLHEQLNTESFKTTYNQFETLEKIGKLSIAIKSLYDTKHLFQDM